MKRNLFSLLLVTGLVIFTTTIYAQGNNYIVSKYDFIPGEEVIFFDDFTSENVGDFPAQWLPNSVLMGMLLSLSNQMRNIILQSGFRNNG